VYPQDPPPYPGQPGQQPPFPQFSKDSSPQYPAPYPPTQAYPPYPPEPPPQYPTYPPYPAGAQQYPSGYQQYPIGAPQYPGGAQQYPGQPPAHPGHGYPQAPYQPPPRRTEFGWASIIVASIALLLSPIPYFNLVVMLAAIVLVLAGWLGKHERSRIPAAFGAGIAGLALVSTVIFLLFWRDIFGGFFGF
jgi:hypothetical protein